MTPFNSDVAPLDAETVATYVGQNLDINSIILGNEYFYQSLTLCVIDAVYSIGVKYQGVEKVVERYCKHYGLVKIRTPRENIPPKGPQESIADLCNKFKKNGHECKRPGNAVLQLQKRSAGSWRDDLCGHRPRE